MEHRRYDTMEMFLLEQFVAFAKNGTLTKAAEELHISQPALSRSMKKIEEELGVSLFERHGNRIELNETGKVAAEYAQRVLEAEREMFEKTVAFERSRRSIVFGVCAFLPANMIVPILQKCFGGMSFEIADDDRLLSGLRRGIYDFVVLHEKPKDKDVYYMKYMDEHLHISLPRTHRLADRKQLSFRDLRGETILAHGGSGFWLDICKRNLRDVKLIVQDSIDSLSELVDASSLPAFDSDRTVQHGEISEERVTIPLTDDEAYAVYYLVCMRSQTKKYAPVFRVIDNIC